MEGKKGRLTQDVLRAVCIIVIILREVIDPVTASFVDSCESDSCDSAVMYKVPKSHPTHPMLPFPLPSSNTTTHTSILRVLFCGFTDPIKSIGISIQGSNTTHCGALFGVGGVWGPQ